MKTELDLDPKDWEDKISELAAQIFLRDRNNRLVKYLGMVDTRESFLYWEALIKSFNDPPTHLPRNPQEGIRVMVNYLNALLEERKNFPGEGDRIH